MDASREDVQALTDQILELLGARVRCGQVVLHLNDALLTGVEVNTVHKPAPRPMRKDGTARERSS